MSKRRDKKVITAGELVNLLLNLRTATPASITHISDPRMNKKSRVTGEPNPYTDVVKMSRKHVMLNFEYANSVNRARGKEDKEQNFTPHPRKWGVHHEGSRVVIEHRGTFYCQCRLLNTLESRYVRQSNSEEVDKSLLEEYLPQRSGRSRQGLDDEVIINDIRIGNIVAISVLGTDYTVAIA